MKQDFYRPRQIIAFIAAFIILLNCGCKKDTAPTPSYPIQGLWVGTYTIGPGTPVPEGTSFYFSFSIYPDGTVSYKSKGFYNNSNDYITFADGTWTLNGTAFAFSVVTINIAGGGAQHTQTGTATYNSKDGSLTNGLISDNAGGDPTPWTMNRVK